MPSVKRETYGYIRSVEIKKLKDEKLLYLITTDEDKFATFKPAIAEKARMYEGHEAHLLYTEVEKGDFKDNWLDDVKEPENSKPKEPPTKVSDKDLQIARAVALKAAVEYVSTPEQEREALENLLDLFDVFTDRLLGRA